MEPTAREHVELHLCEFTDNSLYFARRARDPRPGSSPSQTRTVYGIRARPRALGLGCRREPGYTNTARSCSVSQDGKPLGLGSSVEEVPKRGVTVVLQNKAMPLAYDLNVASRWCH